MSAATEHSAQALAPAMMQSVQLSRLELQLTTADIVVWP
jgi:hypothetical protein